MFWFLLSLYSVLCFLSRILSFFLFDLLCFFFKQKTSYEMRISDWSSDVCSSDLIEKPGDYMTLRLVGEPVIISRTRDGRISASYNMCVHRGVEVAEGRGNTRAFKCPYHGWIYDLEGKLTGAAHMTDSAGFDFSNRSEEPSSELQSLMHIPFAAFCLKK